MKSFQIAVASLVVVASYNFSANAATEAITGFGQNGWYSWDTRNTSGTTLNGTNDTSPDMNSTLLGRAVGSPSTANDTAIGTNIIFMDEGTVANDNGDAAGNPPPASPLGSLNGLGYVRLDGTGSNSGKSDISYVNANGFASSSALLDPNFNVTYRYYIQPQNTFRTLGMNIALTDAAKDNLYIFAYVDPAAANGWNTSAANNSTSLFTLFANGTNVGPGTAKTLSDWATDPTYGTQIFGGNESVFRLGFNVGSGQKDNLQYLDWTSTSLLNNGDLIDFQVVQAVPEPATWFAAVLAAGGVLGMRFRRRVGVATSL